MRIALIIENFNTQAGGNERSTAQIATGLAERGHEVTVITGSCRNPKMLPGVRIIAQRSRKRASFIRLVAFALWARKQLEQGKFDATWSVTPVVPAMVFQPHGGTVRETLARNLVLCPTAWARLCKWLEIKTTAKKQALLFLERRLARDPRVKRFVAISSYVADQFQHHYGIEPDRIARIAFGAEMPRLAEERRAELRRQIRQAFGITPASTVYLFPAQNPRLKGLPALLRALRRLVDEGRDVMVLMAGSRPYLTHVAVNRSGLNEHVRLVGFTEQMAALYAAADVTVLPTFYDPCSLVVMESLMAGTPAISTAFNGASDFIVPAGGGEPRGRVIEDPGDDAALARAMAELSDPEIRERCRQATARLEDDLDMRHHLDALEQLLMKVAEESGEPASVGPGLPG